MPRNRSMRTSFFAPFFAPVFLAALLCLLVAAPIRAEELTLRPFATDGCSAFPDGLPWQEQKWLACCVEHDRAYWAGGTHEERLSADLALRDCVAATGEPLLAELMLQGVRLGGSPYLPTDFRWGYGWEGLRGYRPLSDREQRAVAEMTQAQGD